MYVVTRRFVAGKQCWSSHHVPSLLKRKVQAWRLEKQNFSNNFPIRTIQASNAILSKNLRFFSGMRTAQDELYEQNLFNEEFEQEVVQFEKQKSSMRRIDRKGEDELRHGDDGGMVYKYDLPVVNLPFDLKNQLLVIDEEREVQTDVQKLFEVLDCDKDTAYESFIIKFSQEFNTEVDMYGDVRKAGETDLRVLDFGIPIPTQFLAEESNMLTVRRMFKFNADIPGAIEVVHPNKFLPNLRPVEDFRNTPIIPISERDILENKKKIEERNRKGYYVEIKKDTIYFYTIACISLGIVFYTFLMVNEKQMRIKTDIERTKSLRQRASQGKEGMNKKAEMDKANMLRGNKPF